MRYLLLTFIFASCASVNKSAVVKNAKKISPKSLKTKTSLITQMVRSKSSLKPKSKKEIELILDQMFKKAQNLRDEESQLIQQIAAYTIEKKGTYEQVIALDKALKGVYEKKYANLNSSVKKLKKVLKIKPNETDFINSPIEGMFGRL